MNAVTLNPTFLSAKARAAPGAARGAAARRAAPRRGLVVTASSGSGKKKGACEESPEPSRGASPRAEAAASPLEPPGAVAARPARAARARPAPATPPPRDPRPLAPPARRFAPPSRHPRFFHVLTSVVRKILPNPTRPAPPQGGRRARQRPPQRPLRGRERRGARPRGTIAHENPVREPPRVPARARRRRGLNNRGAAHSRDPSRRSGVSRKTNNAERLRERKKKQNGAPASRSRLVQPSRLAKNPPPPLSSSVPPFQRTLDAAAVRDHDQGEDAPAPRPRAHRV